MIELGIFQDGELLEGALYSEADAAKAIEARYRDETGLTIEAICPDHPEQPKEGCEECNSEEA